MIRVSSVGRRVAVAVSVMALATSLVAGCSKDGQQAQPQQQATTASPAADVAPANVATNLLTKDVGALAGDGAKVTILNTPTAPGLALAMDVVRNHTLRMRSYGQLPKALQIQSGVFASSSKAVGVKQVVTTGKQQLGTSTIVYDALANKAYASSALVQPSLWGDLVGKVQAQAGDKGEQVAAAMAKPQFPYGAGPSLTFNKAGDLVVIFPASTKLGSFRLSDEETGPLLTTLGQRVRAGVRYPTAYAPTAKTAGAPSTIGDLAGVQPTGDVKAKRPTTGLGPDCTKLKCVAITFDDGPIPQTADLLATLTKAKAPASFFVLGTSVDANPQLVTQEALAGMVVGSHNQVHNAMTLSGDETLKGQLSKSATNIRKLTGAKPMFMRPPYGDRSKRVDALIGGAQMSVLLWSIDTNDWQVSGQSQASAQSYILNNVVGQTEPGGILLMHDIHQNSRDSVPAVIEKLRADGYTLVTLSELGHNDYAWGAKVCKAPALGTPCGG